MHRLEEQVPGQFWWRLQPHWKFIEFLLSSGAQHPKSNCWKMLVCSNMSWSQEPSCRVTFLLVRSRSRSQLKGQTFKNHCAQWIVDSTSCFAYAWLVNDHSLSLQHKNIFGDQYQKLLLLYKGKLAAVCKVLHQDLAHLLYLRKKWADGDVVADNLFCVVWIDGGDKAWENH